MKTCRLALTTLIIACLVLPSAVCGAEYKFGVTPWQKGKTADDITHMYRPLLDWLGMKTGHSFTVFQAENYNQMIGYIANGKVDLANLSPVPYVHAKKSNPDISLLVTEVKWNDDKTKKIDSYLGYFVTLKKRSDINSIKDLKGKNFGFVKMNSSSGFKYPYAILRDQGINIRNFFSNYSFLGSHPKVTDSLAAGKIDAGATWDFNLSQAVNKHGDIFKIIYTTPPIPNLCIAAHPSLPDDLQKKIRELLLTVDENLLEGLPAIGYVARPDSFYDIVRKIEE